MAVEAGEVFNFLPRADPPGRIKRRTASTPPISAASFDAQKPLPSDVGEKKTPASGSSRPRPKRIASASAASLEFKDRKMRDLDPNHEASSLPDYPVAPPDSNRFPAPLSPRFKFKPIWTRRPLALY
jgi:hypothetical protein